MEMAIVAGRHPVKLQQVHDLLTDITLIAGRIVKKAELRRLPCRLQRSLQAQEFPVEYLLIVACLLYTSDAADD